MPPRPRHFPSRRPALWGWLRAIALSTVTTTAWPRRLKLIQRLPRDPPHLPRRRRARRRYDMRQGVERPARAASTSRWRRKQGTMDSHHNIVVIGGGGQQELERSKSRSGDSSRAGEGRFRIKGYPSADTRFGGGRSGSRRWQRIDKHGRKSLRHRSVARDDWFVRPKSSSEVVARGAAGVVQLEHWGCPWSRKPDGRIAFAHSAE